MTEANAPLIRTDIPHSARIWNYWMGGKDYYEIDRVAGDAGKEVDPEITTMAVQSRQFLIRAVSYLTGEIGIRQFLDIGTGLPTMQNTHEVAQSIAPESKIVYVDNDPLVLTHARALLTSTTPEGVTTYIDSDYHFPEQIITSARNVLNFNQPIGVMFMGVLGHAASYEELRRIVRTVLDAVPSGSYLVMWDGTDDSEAYVTLCKEYTNTGGAPYVPRPQAEIRAVFDGLELVEPGFTSLTQWRAPDAEVGEIRPISAYCAVARKP
ncbi:SAM-dependent methyltransferase [Nocardia bovistercoris]|uniref:SAM-dependent methyltransferase n=1 Tax=Nocardia bovistercoris TaxID=2785916 RepID=A0A931N270_9NOCA|nr:SAM-dependent methyltransferase [Nocardia bovistercoris]MBH0779180.1 SAM-dependent methyltransferase [Nocardia bovistercoris]